ncbi:MAG: hypothetical protein A2289_18715 [Deltaproteobacteria bacterium RIFOXYA12_FULL_58_15]|nr:MAG: hypothetical protein A2289_18715 [Deltaproteobacteria bacterium RIFOXYA12_FULL_58_15]OGR14140.1 MAG: hypothetical protein A2341_15800 [Deltaproteobacteria bacterium RIFOXYB12_FULL_58_9]
MQPNDPYDFDIDVDISPILEDVDTPTLLDGHWYELTRPRAGRSAALQDKMERTFRNAMLHAQWRATSRRSLDRRRAMRVPLLSRLHVDGGNHLVTCDISMSGLRCSGTPLAPLMDVEFRLPKVDFPIDARVEVVSFKEANVIPLVGLRFAWIDKPYVHYIADYISQRREKLLTSKVA